MNLLSFFLALFPVLVILILLVWRRMAADTAGIDRIGEESAVLRVTFFVSVLITAACAILTYFWAF
jgi:L-lactate permease